jgi:two-component system sensor histidine kinase KdpD
MRHYMRDHAIRTTWPVAERILACVGPSPRSGSVVRAAKRFADALRAEWIVATVETPATARLTQADRHRLAETLRLAEQLGAETVVLSGHGVSDEILAHARLRNASKIVVGKPVQPRWRRALFGSIADALVRGSGQTDVYVISGEESPHVPYIAPRQPRGTDWAAYGRAAAIVALCTGVAWAMFPFFELSNLIMVYLLGVVGVAARSTPGPSVLACALSVAAFDFFFVPPFLTFAVSDTQYFVTFAVMFVVALLIGGLTGRIRWLAQAAEQRERRTAALYALSRELAGVRGVTNILEAATRHVAEVFRSRVVVLLSDATGALAPRADLTGGYEMDASELAVGRWVYEHKQMAGLGTATLPGVKALYLPLVASRGPIGTLGVCPRDPQTLESPEQIHQLETFANQTALALERGQLAEVAQEAHIRAEKEQLRSSLLSSVSHDLRTPLATITGAASSLLEVEGRLDDPTRRDLLESIAEEAGRLSRLVGNLLQMTRLESGAVEVRKEWQPLEEVVGAALSHVGQHIKGHPLSVRIPKELPLVPMDDVLIEQVLINLLDNAGKYSPEGAAIAVAAWSEEQTIVTEVADRGPGLPSGAEEQVFEKFYRGRSGAGQRGAGLGLAICRGIVEAHGGRIWAANRPDGGAVFRFALPAGGTPPEMRQSDDD